MGNECCTLRDEKSFTESNASKGIKIENEGNCDQKEDKEKELKAMKLDIIDLIGTYNKAKKQGAISLDAVES